MSFYTFFSNANRNNKMNLKKKKNEFKKEKKMNLKKKKK